MPKVKTNGMHKTLNKRWLLSKELKKYFSKKYACSKIKASFGNYVSMGNKEEKAEYPLPVFSTKEVEIGVTLSEIYTTYVLETKNLNADFIIQVKRKFLDVKIYGWVNFLDRLFFEKNMNELKKSIGRYRKISKYFQISLEYDLEEKRKPLKDYQWLMELSKKNKIKFRNDIKNKLKYYD